MASVTCYAIPFSRDHGGKLRPGEAKEVRTAIRQAMARG